MFASAPLLPKFVSEGAAMYHELRKRGTSAADLKFLHRLRQTHFRNFKSKSGTRIICLLVPLLLPKFVSEGAAMYHDFRRRGSSRVMTIKKIAQFLPMGNVLRGS